MKVTILGATGNMGRATIKALLPLPFVETLSVLIRSRRKEEDFRKAFARDIDRFDIVLGDTTDEEALSRLVGGSDVVIDLAASIPPRSDHDPKGAVAANEEGPKRLVRILKRENPMAFFIHVSTVALYGDRTLAHPVGKVGDPVLPSPLDMYSTTKARGELAVLESGLPRWIVLRQTAMFSDDFLKNNMNDGLMFHTRLDSPLEWVSDKDSATLLSRIVMAKEEGRLSEDFYRRVYDVAGGKRSRVYGYQVFSLGLSLAGLSFRKVFRPKDFVTRNFHGVWYEDVNPLQEMFSYQKDSIYDYFELQRKKHPLWKMARCLPQSLIRHILCDVLLGKNDNTPSLWYKRKDEARITAFFGGFQAYDSLPSAWKDFPLPEKIPDDLKGLDPLYDRDKPEEEIDFEDLKNLARLHGGEFLESSFQKGDVHTPLAFKDQDGNDFRMSAYSVYKAGHWNNPSLSRLIWDFDRIARRDRIYAQVWLESHSIEEDVLYGMDENFLPYVRKGGKA